MLCWSTRRNCRGELYNSSFSLYSTSAQIWQTRLRSTSSWKVEGIIIQYIEWGNRGSDGKGGRVTPATEDGLDDISELPEGYMSNDKNSNPKPHSTCKTSDELDIHRHDRCCREETSRRHQNCHHQRFLKVSALNRNQSSSGVQVLVQVNKSYQTTVDYQSYRGIYWSQCYDDDPVS